MTGSTWIASALGIAAGVAVCYAALKTLLPHFIRQSKDALLLVRLALAGTIVALLPALALSLVVGATLGGVWGRQVFEPYGLAASGVPIGVALGTALVLAVVVLAGAAAGIGLGKALLYVRQRRAST